jgi:Zn-dependent protease with chaperone function
MKLLHRLLLVLYFPFILLVCAATLGVVIGLFSLEASGCGRFLTILIALVLLATLVQVLWTFWFVLTAPRERDELELRLPRKALRELYEFVGEVAKQRGLRPPDQIRLGAGTVAHVYEDRKGEKILVIGGITLAAFTQEVLAGIVAHELAHFDAGDTRLLRQASQRALFMAVLEYRFQLQRTALLNPLVWLLYLYHFLYRCAWAANSRQQEFLADQESVRQVGKEASAADLIYLSVTEHLPWARLSSIIEACVANNEPMSRVFAEQVQRARATTRSEWEDALHRALRQRTGLFDSHPALKERLAALGVSPRKALKAALDRSGPPAHQLIPGWERVEKELSDRLIAPYREAYLAKMEMAQIILGRPIGR